MAGERRFAWDTGRLATRSETTGLCHEMAAPDEWVVELTLEGHFPAKSPTGAWASTHPVRRIEERSDHPAG